MLTIGDRLPAFRLKAAGPEAEPGMPLPELTDESFPGQWKLLFFWPKDFTFVCPTEILGFDAAFEEFAARNCAIIGASTDTDAVHVAWRLSRADLGRVRFPWLADHNKRLASALGILDPAEGVARRATFLVDPDNIIRFVYVTDDGVGRSPEEVLRVLDALQTGALCPCGWKPGDETIDPKRAA